MQLSKCLFFEEIIVLVQTRIPFAVEVVTLITPALALGMRSSLWAMLEGLMPITDIVEKVDLILVCKKSCADAVNWGVSPALIVEPALGVKMLEELHVRLATPESQVTNLKVTPEVALIIRLTAVIGKETHAIIFRKVLWVHLDEFFGGSPERWYRLNILVKGNGESINLLIILHEQEWVIVYVAE